MSRIVIVTGGAGFIGSHLVEALVERGDRVRIVDNLSTGDFNHLASVVDQIEFYEGDICDSGLMDRVCRGAELLFHQAALASVPLSLERPRDVHRACADGTLMVLQAARQHRVRRVVYAGSSSCYGNREVAANRETDPLEPLSPYAAAKLCGEMYCQAFCHSHGLDTVILRYFNVFGPRQDPNSPYSAVIPIFVTRLLNGQSPVVYGSGRQTRDFTYVENIVQANLLAAEVDDVAGRTINVASGRATSLLELLDHLQASTGQSAEPEFDQPRAGEVMHSMADITLAKSLLGYQPAVDMVEGLRRTVTHYRESLEQQPVAASPR